MAIRFDSGWDLSVDNRYGELILAVEVKQKTDVSPEWATQFRRNILAHGTLPKTPYFLMVFPNDFFLWNGNNAYIENSQPNYVIDARLVLKHYFEKTNINPNTISSVGLEIIIVSWLGEIIYSEKSPKNLDSSQQWLLQSGLYAALFGGKVVG